MASDTDGAQGRPREPPTPALVLSFWEDVFNSPGWEGAE